MAVWGSRQIAVCCNVLQVYPRRCKASSVDQSAGLIITRSWVRFWQKLKKTENLNLHGFELHRPSRKGNKFLLKVIKAIKNQNCSVSREGCVAVWNTMLQVCCSVLQRLSRGHYTPSIGTLIISGVRCIMVFWVNKQLFSWAEPPPELVCK